MKDTGAFVAMVRGALEDCGLAYSKALRDPSGSEAFLVRQQDGYKINMDVFFSFTFDVRRLENPSSAGEELAQGLKPLYDSLRASPWIKRLEEKLAALENEVGLLKPYRTYYDMEYTLRQGRNE